MTSHALDPTLSEPGFHTLTTRDGTTLRLRPVTHHHSALLSELFASLDPDDLRYRFLGGGDHISALQLAAMIEVDHRHCEHLLAFEIKTLKLVASTLIASDDHMDCAEVAIVVHRDFKGRGIGWSLLKHAADLARERGIRRVRSIESRANYQAIEIEQMQGFTARPCQGDPGLVVLEARLD